MTCKLRSGWDKEDGLQSIREKDVGRKGSYAKALEVEWAPVFKEKTRETEPGKGPLCFGGIRSVVESVWPLSSPNYVSPPLWPTAT